MTTATKTKKATRITAKVAIRMLATEQKISVAEAKTRLTNAEQQIKQDGGKAMIADCLELARDFYRHVPAGATKKATKAKTAPAKKAEPDRIALEKELIAKYPDANIIPGSLLLAGDSMGSPTKRTVAIKCCICSDGTRRIATSDVFQTRTCSDQCRKLAKKEAAAKAAK
jgi:hypothetical protein